MSVLPGLTLGKYEINQKIDLSEFVEGDLSEADVLSIGQDLIDVILERTEKNNDVNGRSFKSYKKTYINSADFERYGKSESDVNLTMTGDMLSSLDIIDHDDKSITLGFDDENEPKAANHNLGVTVKKRQFFGVTKAEIEAIVGSYDRKETKETSSILSALEDLTKKSNQTGVDTLIDQLFGTDYGEG